VSQKDWTLERSYASVIYPQKGVAEPESPTTYVLKVDSSFRQAITQATQAVSRRRLSSIVLNMSDDREHPVRDAMLKVAFGQTRTPLTGMTNLASRLSEATDRRTNPSLFVTTIEEKGDARRLCMYVFPEESSYTLRTSKREPTEAILEHLTTFVLESQLRKVARFEGKEIKTHFIGGEVLDLQIGKGPRSIADYFVTDFLDAEFSINEYKGTTLVAEGLKAAFAHADSIGKQKIMEATMALMADGRRSWSLSRISEAYLPESLQPAFLSIAPNDETMGNSFMLNKDQLKEIINYRVFQIEHGVWVSAPFNQVGKSVTIQVEGKKRFLTARGVIENEKVQRDAKRPRSNQGGL
jgi:hypothetical protein